jgi:hypothetical protein
MENGHIRIGQGDVRSHRHRSSATRPHLHQLPASQQSGQ